VKVEIGQVLSHYRLLEEIDTGGQGTVFRAEDLRLHRDVAVKVLPEGALSSPEARRRFHREARALSLLNHPNIQAVHDFDSQEGVDFLVSEFISGITLKEKVASNGSFSETELARIGLQIADGIAAAHEKGVVHRDLSAKNLIVSPDGRLKIIDFGLARLTQAPSETASTETLTASIAGTLPYMAPEQLIGSADARTDIYGVGVLLYQMATGRLPFAGLEGPALMAAIQAQSPPSPAQFNPRLSARMQDVLLKCLEKEPDRRYQSAKELAVDLRRILEPWPIPPIPTHHLLWFLTASLLIAVGAGIAIKTGLLPIGNGGPWFDHPAMAAVTAWPGQEQGSRISPDRQWISYLANRSGKPTLWRRHVSGGEPEAVAVESGNILGQVWSPTGLEIAYLQLLNGSVFLKFVSAFGGSPSRVIPMDVRFKDAGLVRWVGTRIYLQLDGLWRLDLNGGTPTRILERASAAGLGEQFDVSSDEKSVVYVVHQGDRSTLWVSALNGRSPRRITAHAGSDYQPHWAGRRGIMYVSDQGGQPDIWYQALDKGKPRQITFSSVAENLEDVAGDASLVTFTQETGAGGLWRLPLEEKNPHGTQLTTGSPLDFWPVARDSVLIFQKWRPGTEGASTLFDNGIYRARFLPPEPPQDSRLIVDKGAFPSLGPGGRFVSYISESSNAGAQLCVYDLWEGHNRTLISRFITPTFFMEPLSIFGPTQAWSPSGDTLFAVAITQDASVIWRFPLRFESEGPAMIWTVSKKDDLSDLFVSPDGSRLAYVHTVLGEENLWEVHVRDLVAGSDGLRYQEAGRDFQNFILRGWMGKDALLAVKIGVNADWTHRLEFLEIAPAGSRSLGVVDRAFAGTVIYDAARGRIYFIGLGEVGGAANIYALDVVHGRLHRLTDNRTPSVTFAGLELAGSDALLYSMVEHNQDIWMVQFERGKRSGKGKV
jgi:serine/threonine protein kinase